MSDMTDLIRALDDSNRAFGEFKAANDLRIAALESGKTVPAELNERIAKIQKEFGEQKSLIEVLEAKMKRPQFGAQLAQPYMFGRSELKGYADTEVQRAHRDGFKGFLRKGRTDALLDLEAKAWAEVMGITESEYKATSISSGPDGGFAVPKVIDAMIEATIVNISPIRGLAAVQQISTPDFHKLVNIHGTASGWVGEKSTRPATATSSLEDINPPMGEIYAYPQATQTMLDDVFFNSEQWMADEVALEFARAEGAAFCNGTGVQQPRGFLTYPTAATADATRAFGTVEVWGTGANGAFKTLSGTVNPVDDLFSLISRLKKGYRAGSAWVMNKNTLFAIMAMKDYQGRYVFNPTTSPAIEDTVLGYPVVEAEDMPDYTGAAALAIAFGNWKRFYLIVDRIGTRVIRDPFSNKPYVGFYTTRREGGAVVNSECVKLLRMS